MNTTTCPYCGADKLDGYNRFACSTRQDSELPTYICLRRQIAALKETLAQSVRRDDPRLKEAVSEMGWVYEASKSKHVKDWVAKAKDNLQSIIEGK